MSTPDVLRSPEVEHHGDRAIVDEFDTHVGAESAGLDGGAERPESFDDSLHERLGSFRTGRGDPTRAAPLRRVAVERELAHDEERPAGVRNGPVHHAVFVVEDAQSPEFLRELVGSVGRVGVRHPDEHAQPGPDRSGDLPIGLGRRTAGDLGSDDTLHECSHAVQYRPVEDADPTLTLRSGDVTVTVHPDAGARIGQIDVAGQPLMIDVPLDGERHPTLWGSFAMTPWAGRIRSGRFSFDGADHQLPINHHDGPDPRNAHAIHGLAFDRPWHVRTVSGTSCTCSLEFDWEFGGTVSQVVTLQPDRVVVELVVESTGVAFPAEVGWHPWFRTPDRLEFAPAAMYERDEFGLPTGEMVGPTEGPWDDCFVATGPVVAHYDRPIAPIVKVDSDCDHWVVFDQPSDATCIEPQSGPPDAFNLQPHVVTTDEPLARTMTISW